MIRKILTHESLIAKLSNDKNINFVAIVITPWHVHGVEAYLHFLTKNNVPVKGFYIVLPHPDTGYSVNSDTFAGTELDVYKFEDQRSFWEKVFGKYLFYRYLFIDFNNFKRSKRNIYLVSTTPPSFYASYINFFIRAHITFVIIDEGVAAYMGTFKISPPKFNRTFFKCFPKYLEKQILSRDIVSKFHDIQYFRTLLRLNGRWQPNKVAIPFYKEAIELKTCKTEKLFIEKESIILCGTAWNRKLIRDNHDLIILKNVIDELVKSHKCVYFKPHPRDIYSANFIKHLDCKFIPKSVSLELICSMSRPKLILGYSSTTLVIPNLIWDIQTINLAKLLNRSLIDDFYLREIDSFENTFGDLVHSVNAIHDIDNLF